MTMLRGLWGPLLVCGCSASPPFDPVELRMNPGAPSEPAPEVASYAWNVELDVQRHIVRGRGHVDFRNVSSRALHSVFLHLYPNAFHADSAFMKDAGGGHQGRPGSIQVSVVRAPALSDLNLATTARFLPPEDAPLDQTDLEVPLPQSLAPGEKIRFEMEFETVLPELTLRSGVWGSLHVVSQWFPKLAKLEPDGTFRHFAFRHNAEFYADFGAYDVEVRLPKAYVAAASANLVSWRDEGEHRWFRFQQAGVHDFAFAAWDHFAVEVRPPTEALPSLVCFFPQGENERAARILETIATTLPKLEKWYGAYPYDRLSAVLVPDGAAAAGDMEYPTLITLSGDRLSEILDDTHLEDVVVHELTHQWFYGLIATDEARWPFLDEGITQFTESTLASDRKRTLLGPDPWPVLRLWRGEGDLTRASDQFDSAGGYESGIYAAVPTILATAARLFGREHVVSALGRFARRYRFQHPTKEQFLASMGETLGADEGGWLRKALEGERATDCKIEAVDPGRASNEKLAAWQVHVECDGTLPRSVELEFKTEVGEVFYRALTHSETLRGESAAPLIRVRLDPDVRYLLDRRLENNVWVAAHRPDGSWLRAPAVLVGWL